MEEEIRIRSPRGKEVLGVVESLLGANKIRVMCQDGKLRMCRIPGKMRKRVWIRENDAVLIEPWEIQGNENGNVKWRYTPTESSWLRRKGILKL